MDILISSSSSKPIYEQITSQIKAQIMSGALQPGEALPSMRALAKSIHGRTSGIPLETLLEILTMFYQEGE